MFIGFVFHIQMGKMKGNTTNWEIKGTMKWQSDKKNQIHPRDGGILQLLIVPCFDNITDIHVDSWQIDQLQIKFCGILLIFRCEWNGAIMKMKWKFHVRSGNCELKAWKLKHQWRMCGKFTNFNLFMPYFSITEIQLSIYVAVSVCARESVLWHTNWKNGETNIVTVDKTCMPYFCYVYFCKMVFMFDSNLFFCYCWCCRCVFFSFISIRMKAL